jgi:hypothetical protein
VPQLPQRFARRCAEPARPGGGDENCLAGLNCKGWLLFSGDNARSIMVLEGAPVMRILAISIVIAASIFAFASAQGDRYYMHQHSQAVFVLDRMTGGVEMCLVRRFEGPDCYTVR